MNCYECAKAGTAQPAVALCYRCGCGLCLAHLRDEGDYLGPGGTTFDCSHDTWKPGAQSSSGGIASRARAAGERLDLAPAEGA
jgi:hypothetical protein